MAPRHGTSSCSHASRLRFFARKPKAYSAAGKTVYLINGKAMVALVPAHPAHETHEVSSSPDVLAINRRLAASEKTPKAAWAPGDARRRVLRSLRRKLGR